MADVKTADALQHAATDCEQVAKAIEAIGVAAQRVISGPLSMRALCLLIKDALPRGSREVPLGDIQAVLEATSSIGRRHLVRKAP